MESPKFHMCNGVYEEAFKSIQAMIGYVQRKSDICNIFNQPIKDRLIKVEKEIQKNKVESNYSILISIDFLYLSSLTCGIFFLVSFILYGAFYILPRAMEIGKNGSGKNQFNSEIGGIYIGLIISALSELLGIIVTSCLANIASFGRVKYTSLGFALTGFGAFGCFLFPGYISLFASTSKFALCIAFNIMFLYTCEAYPTKIRSIALGVSNSFTRFGGIFTPFIIEVFFNIHYTLPFFIYGMASLLACVLTILLLIETLNRNLD